MAKTTLALVIPTYCRAPLLAKGLAHMAEALVANGVTLYISDDSPDDATETMLRGFAERMPDIRYRRNQPALRHDLNIVRSLLWPTEDFVWILGDAGMVEPAGLDRVLALLDDQDLIFVNSHAPETADIPHMTGETARIFVRDQFWHQTLTGATIYSRRMLDWVRDTTPNGEGLVRNFPHLSLIVDYMAAAEPDIGWVGRHATRFSPKDSYWRKSALSVFVDDWAKAIRRQPSVIRAEEYPAVLRSHSQNTGLFAVGLLTELRRAGALNREYVRGQPDFADAMHLPKWLLRAIMLLPVGVLEQGARVSRYLRRR